MQREAGEARRRRREEQETEELRLLLENRAALFNYINRIGATMRNFRSYAIQEMDDDSGYWRDLVRIKIKQDGTVDVNVMPKAGDDIDPADYEPTEEEQEQLRGMQFPHSLKASFGPGDMPSDLIGVDPQEYFLYADAKEKGLVTFVQWRREDDEGRTYYLPYSKWSDGVWRRMEPDGLLPLYGLDRLAKTHGAMRVMIHEGAKCARHTQALVDSKADHPWMPDLSMYVHLGWPGGVNSADRVDWSPIKKKVDPNIPVVLVCDNDTSGMDVARPISRILQRSMMAVRFNDQFPNSFDLGDPWPRHQKWWRSDGRYRGPSLDSLCVPATWATKVVKIPRERGRPPTVHKIVEPFAKEWLWVEDLDVFINRRQLNRMLPRSQFNSLVSTFSDVKDTAALLDQQLSPKCDGVAYEPGEQPGVINVGNRRMVNTYRPGDVIPVMGDPAPFLEFMEHLIPVKRERHELLRWMTTLVKHPDIRMRYAVLLISQAQGVGKTTLAEILEPLVGEWNTSLPSEKAIIDSGFNSWVAHKRLAIVHEMDSGQAKKVYTALKSILTDRGVTVNEKYIKEYIINNHLTAMACSNSMNALYLVAEDRRWFVPKVTETLKDKAFWERFHNWLKDDGLGIILNYLTELAQDPANIVGTGDHAPMSATKEEIISESRSVGEQIAYDLGVHALEMNTVSEERPQDKLEKVVLTLNEVRSFVANRRGLLSLNDPKLETPLELRKALVRAGLKEPETEMGKSRPRFMVDIEHSKAGQGRKAHWVKTFVVANFEIAPGTKWDQTF